MTQAIGKKHVGGRFRGRTDLSALALGASVGALLGVLVGLIISELVVSNDVISVVATLAGLVIGLYQIKSGANYEDKEM